MPGAALRRQILVYLAGALDILAIGDAGVAYGCDAICAVVLTLSLGADTVVLIQGIGTMKR